MEIRRNQLRRYAIIIPVCDEEACLGRVIDELQQVLPAEGFVLSVGLNGSSDASGQVAAERGVMVGETKLRGYGHGCMAAIDALRVEAVEVEAYIFYAGDGASRPQDVLALVQRFEATRAPLVIGLRSFDLRTWWLQFARALPNLILGLVGFFLTGRFYHDLGPLRLIEFELFNRLALQELTWGWTIEAEVKASVMGVRVETLEVVERARLAGEQKVSGVSLWRSAYIGVHILSSGLRSRWGGD